MKLIIAIVPDENNEAVSQALIKAGLRVTRIASTGGFFKSGSSTLVIGLETEQVDEAIQYIRQCCPPSPHPIHKHVTLFVLNVVQMEKI